MGKKSRDSKLNKTHSKLTKNARGAAFVSLVLLLAATPSIYWSRDSLRSYQKDARDIGGATPLYLPEVRYVKLTTLGFDNFASDVLWFKTISYFGEQFSQGNEIEWFGHMCDLVTRLDRKKKDVFEFCATLLSWIAKEPKKSNELLNRAILENPDHWRYWYLRGFNNWYFLEQKDLARRDMERAAKIDGAPAFLATLASRLMVSEDDPQTAIAFLRDMIKNTKDESAKEALKQKLMRGVLSRDLRLLGQIKENFEKQTNRKVSDLNQLVQAGLLRNIPREPFGGEYYVDSETGEIKNSSGEKGLEFFGKTAKTGVMRREWKDQEEEK